MNKGIILEIKEREVIVLTPDGSFCTVKRKRSNELGVGDEIEFPGSKQFLWSLYSGKWLVSSLASLFFLVIITYLVWNSFLVKQGEAIAYVYVDINPSVELSVNPAIEVINLQAINQDGEKLLSFLNYNSRKTLDEVTLELLSLAREQGYLAKNSDVLISTSFTDEEKSDQVQAINLALDEAGTKFYQKYKKNTVVVQEDSPELKEVVQIHRLQTDLNMRTEAKEKGVSPGKYSIYLKLQEFGIEADLEEILDTSISDLNMKFGGLDSINITPEWAPNTDQERQGSEPGPRNLEVEPIRFNQEGQRGKSEETKEKGNPERGKSEESKEKGKPEQGKSEESKEKGNPERGKSEEAKEKGNPERGKSEEAKEKGNPERGKSEESKEKGNPERGKPEETKEKGKPERGKSEEGKEKGKPERGKSEESKEKGNPQRGKSEESKEKGNPERGKSEESKEKGNPQRGKSEESKERKELEQGKPQKENEIRVPEQGKLTV